MMYIQHRILIILMYLLFTLNASASAQEPGPYRRESWILLKKKYIPYILQRLEDAFTSKSALQTYYYKKYDRAETSAARKAATDILTGYSEDDREKSIPEILAFHHIVYHETAWHHMEENIRVTRRYERVIREFCDIYRVPPEVALAVISWENSGTTGSISYAACAGLGQLSHGAMERAHGYAAKICRQKRLEARRLMKEYRETGNESAGVRAKKLRKDAEFFNLSLKHKKIAASQGFKDERLSPECNAEDTVIFLKILLDEFGGRSDFAIAAYHNGLANMTDLLKDYLRRWMPRMITATPPGRQQLLQALEKYGLTYLSLWNDTRSREMLSGYRTMDGEITTGSNRSEALGDESDIYVWKVLGAYGALHSTDDDLDALRERYRSRWDASECRGLSIYLTFSSIMEAIKAEKLVKIPPVIRDLGVGKLAGAPAYYEQTLRRFNYYVTPELAGFMYRLCREYRQATNSEKALIPVKSLLDSRLLFTTSSRAELESDAHRTHLQGVAFDCPMPPPPEGAILRQILNRYYLTDRVYLIFQETGHIHVCLNPRYGNEFYQYYGEYLNEQKKTSARPAR